MAGVADGDHANANLFSLLDGDVHCLGGYDGAQAAVRVDAGGGGGFADDADVGPGVDFAPLVPAQVAAEHVGDAVAVHTPQVGQHQHVGAQFGVFGGHTHLFENGGDGGLQVVAGYVNGLFKVDSESWQQSSPPGLSMDGQDQAGRGWPGAAAALSSTGPVLCIQYILGKFGWRLQERIGRLQELVGLFHLGQVAAVVDNYEVGAWDGLVVEGAALDGSQPVVPAP